METIQLEKIEFKYGSKKIFENADFTANPGELILVCGKTGSGKSTLLKIIKNRYKECAYVPQNPDSAIVCHKVYEELAFTLVNRNEKEDYINRRIAEVAGFFGISHWLDMDVDRLSGGEKQILNIASAMIANPGTILLDEPAAMLDPVMSDRLGDIITRINRNLGTTIIITEHRPETYFALASKVALIDNGQIHMDIPSKMALYMAQNDTYEYLLPVYSRIFKGKNQVPVSYEQAGNLLRRCIVKNVTNSQNRHINADTALEFKNVTFGYEKKKSILDSLSFNIERGSFTALLGENGAGKSTIANLCVGRLKPYSGKISVNGKVSMLCQDVTLHFTGDEKPDPYDLSGGMRQLYALSKVLEANPDILILDEPTKGLDGWEKEQLAERIKKLTDNNVSVLMITHDIDFAAEYAHKMMLLFGKKIVFSGNTQDFCMENIIYTSTVNRLFKGISDNVYKLSQAVKIIGENK